MGMTRLFFALGLMSLPLACAADPGHAPEEVGKVHWGRDPDAALAASKQSGKPVFALFQEVPGCAGCRQFGRDVLSHPLIVDAIETEFTPLLIHNNAGGGDAEALKRFSEPAWNYQVVRFFDASASDLIPRKDQVWTTGPLAGRMVSALGKAGRTVPPYLKLVAAEHSASLHQAAFAMPCFWTGEMELGKIDGVITTEAGFMAGQEVTLVRYDAGTIKLPALIAQAEKVRCANAVWVPAEDSGEATPSKLKVGVIADYRSAPASDQKKQLEGTAAAPLHLQGAQATKVNAWLRSDAAKARAFLAPSQR
jgi:Peptide methionine sulfoxide reductase